MSNTHDCSIPLPIIRPPSPERILRYLPLEFHFPSRRPHPSCGREWSSDVFFFFSSRRRHTRCGREWSSDVCSSDLDLSPDIQRALRESIELTRNNARIGLNVCFNNGGWAEIVDAIRQIIADGLSLDSITEELISSYLYTRDLPDPDMVIRTAGEMRVSNFLLWQSAYSEYYAVPPLWPDFGREDLREALKSYHLRQRRFGRIPAPPTTVAQGE